MEDPRFELVLGDTNLYYFCLRGSDGEVLLKSEGHPTRASCLINVGSVKLRATVDEAYQRKIAAGGKYYFMIVAPMGEAIGISNMYATEKERDAGIVRVKQDAPVATWKVETGTRS